MTRTQEQDEFLTILVQEYPAVSFATLRELMRLARRHGRLQEKACNQDVPDNHDAGCERRIVALCNEHLPGTTPVFQGDPRGATVKLRVPSGRTNDWGATGICVPQR